MPDPEELLSELRFGGTGRPDFSDIRRQARRRRIRHVAMATVPLSVVVALVAIPLLTDDGGPPASVVAFAPNGGGSEAGVAPSPGGGLTPASEPPATTTAVAEPPTISTLVAGDDPANDGPAPFGADVPDDEGSGPDGSVLDEPGGESVEVGAGASPTTTVAGAAVAGDAAGGEGPASTTTVPVLAVEVAPPLDTGSPVDDLAALPPTGFAVVQDGVTVLADADGALLGHLPTGTSGLTFGRPRPVLAADAVSGCQVAEARRTLRVEICPRQVREHGATYDSREVRLARIDAPSIVVTTPLGRDWYDDPSRPVFGRWRSATVSPEARWMALEWSDSCDAPSAFVVDLQTSELLSATGTQWPVSPESAVLGWADDETLLLHLPGTDAPCGAMAAPPGVYRFRPADGSLVQLVTTEPGATAQLWIQAPVDQ